jgi:hypothetical protein
MPERHFAGSISDQGKLTLLDQPGFSFTLKHLAGHQVILSIDKARSVRSTQQGRYYWGVVVPAFQDTWSIARRKIGIEPLTKDETHAVLVQVILGSDDAPLGTRLPKRTRKLSTLDFSTYVDRCLELAVTEYGLVIPTPGRA